MLKPVMQLVRESITLLKKNFRVIVKYLLLQVLFGVGFMIFSILIGASILGRHFTSEPISSGFGMILTVIGVLGLAAAILGYILLSIALTRSIEKMHKNESLLTVKEEMKQARDVAGQYIWVSILSGLIVLGGLILFIIPGVIFSLWYTFAPFVAILEKKHGMEALRESKKLVQGRWWTVFGYFFVLGLLFFVVSFAIQMIASIPAMIVDTTATQAFASVVTSLTNFILSPIMFIATILFYHNLKDHPANHEKEGSKT